MHLAVTAKDPAQEGLAVIVYGKLFARSQFQAAVSGNVYGPYYDGPGAGNAPVPLDDLVGDPAGGVDVDIPVNAQSGGLSFTTTGVYPVQAFLEDNGVRVGQTLTTFIVYVGKDASTLRRLDTVLVVPLAAKVPISQTGVPGQVPAVAANALEADVAELYLWHVPVAIRASRPRSPHWPKAALPPRMPSASCERRWPRVTNCSRRHSCPSISPPSSAPV